jgi:hypothetical protein
MFFSFRSNHHDEFFKTIFDLPDKVESLPYKQRKQIILGLVYEKADMIAQSYQYRNNHSGLFMRLSGLLLSYTDWDKDSCIEAYREFKTNKTAPNTLYQI